MPCTSLWIGDGRCLTREQSHSCSVAEGALAPGTVVMPKRSACDLMKQPVLKSACLRKLEPDTCRHARWCQARCRSLPLKVAQACSRAAHSSITASLHLIAFANVAPLTLRPESLHIAAGHE